LHRRPLPDLLVWHRWLPLAFAPYRQASGARPEKGAVTFFVSTRILDSTLVLTRQYSDVSILA
jgi:hypothetical protein